MGISVRLTFSEDIPQSVRPRIWYALRVYAAIYGHRVLEETAEDGDAISLVYGGKCFRGSAAKVHIPARYRICDGKEGPPRLAPVRLQQEELYLHHGVDESSGNPDWLGEIFEWLSSSHERGISRRDPVGRVPYCETIFGRQGISPQKPYALLLMAWMENHVRGGPRVGELLRPGSPVTGADHLMVCSHDIDFYYTNWGASLVRLVKNLGISLRPYQSWPYFRANLAMMFGLMGGQRVGDYLPKLVEAGRKTKFSSTIFVVSRHAHRRDPNYRLNHLAKGLQEASNNGFDVGLHGSYTSVIESSSLAAEVAALDEALGRRTVGSRQHWLRFDRHENLFDCIEKAQLKFESTLGFADMVGFRNGAAFAFPPYDFANERPYEFLEIPLVVMDGGLEAASRSLRVNPQELADSVLRESRRWGWGGIAVLWHNPVEPLAVPDEINRVFWNCVKAQERFRERWLSAGEFLSACLSRYQNAGLLTRIGADA